MTLNSVYSTSDYGMLPKNTTQNSSVFSYTNHSIFSYLKDKLKKDFEVQPIVNHSIYGKYLTLYFNLNSSSVDDCINIMVTRYDPTAMLCSLEQIKQERLYFFKRNFKKCKCTVYYFNAYRINHKKYYLLSNKRYSKWYEI